MYTLFPTSRQLALKIFTNHSKKSSLVTQQNELPPNIFEANKNSNNLNIFMKIKNFFLKYLTKDGHLKVTDETIKKEFKNIVTQCVTQLPNKFNESATLYQHDDACLKLDNGNLILTNHKDKVKLITFNNQKQYETFFVNMNKGLNLNLKEVTVKEAEAKSYTTMEVAKYRLKLINRIENFLSSTNDKSFNTYNFIQEMKNIMNNILSYDFMNITSNTKDGKLEKLKKQFIETINCRLQDVASDMNNKYNDLQEDKYNKLQIPTRKNPVVLPTNKFKKGTKYLLTMITNIIDYYQFFASICEINQEFKVAHDIYNNLANMVKNTDGKEEIIKNFYNLAAGISEKCYKPNSTPDQQKQLADQCYKIAKEYELAYNLKKAIEYYSKAIGHYKKTDNNNTILIKSYKKISEMYLKNGDTQNAYKIFKKNGEYHKAMYCAIALNQPKNAEELIMKYTNLQTTPTKQNLKEAIEIYTAAQREDLVAEAYLLKHRLFSEPKVLCS